MTTHELALPSRSRPREAGFSLIETIFGMTILAVALVAYAASTVQHHNLSRAEQNRSKLLQVVREFTERLRADDNWTGMYAWLRDQQAAASASSPSTAVAPLGDGRKAWPLTAYYSDFVVPVDLAGLAVLVDVPAHPPEDDATAPPILRENVVDARFGLPADLNGDGVIDGDSRADDYLALPVLIHFRWVPAGEPPLEIRQATWLHGER